jgi:hypothetical protein
LRSRALRKPSPALIVSVIALFVALSGAAYAGVTLSNNTIRSNHIVNGQVRTADLGTSAVTRAKIANNAVNSAKIANGGVADADIASVAGSKVIGKVASAATADSATSAGNSTTLGGLGPAAFIQGTGHAYHGAVTTSSASVDQVVLTVPGVATVLADCAANGLDTTISIRNDSGGSVNMLGQTFESGVGASLDPNVPGVANGAQATLPVRQVGTTTMQIWSSGTGVSATLVISNIFCLFNASATTNK